MSEIKNSDYYFEQAEFCLRWSRVLTDKKNITELERLADEYTQTGERLLSIENAPYGAHVRTN